MLFNTKPECRYFCLLKVWMRYINHSNGGENVSTLVLPTNHKQENKTLSFLFFTTSILLKTKTQGRWHFFIRVCQLIFGFRKYAWKWIREWELNCSEKLLWEIKLQLCLKDSKRRISLAECWNSLRNWSVPSVGVVEELLIKEMSDLEFYGIFNFCL